MDEQSQKDIKILLKIWEAVDGVSLARAKKLLMSVYEGLDGDVKMPGHFKIYLENETKKFDKTFGGLS